MGFQPYMPELIDLIISRDRFDLPVNWDSCSEQSELDFLNEQRTGVINELKAKVNSEWGDVQAGYDPEGRYITISIRH